VIFPLLLFRIEMKSRDLLKELEKLHCYSDVLLPMDHSGLLWGLETENNHDVFHLGL